MVRAGSNNSIDYCNLYSADGTGCKYGVKADDQWGYVVQMTSKGAGCENSTTVEDPVTVGDCQRGTTSFLVSSSGKQPRSFKEDDVGLQSKQP
ncbi:hypothetical protein DPMN_111910 [Dreissena polymorpha]|uniref:Uncharacterized protein n=1 Tax=Dreissena polymorpha TaxID=45954 RepID=A0A9D4QQE2_DREPO|nr:hypothetical protein DPMN_111910 [Dreissena polymorpha]